MKTIVQITYIILLLLISGCEDYLDVTPKGVVSPNSVRELGELLYGDYKYGYSARSTTMMTDELIVTDETFGNLFKIHKNGYLWEPIFKAGDVDLDWKDIYGKIYTINYVLSLIDEADLAGKSENDRNRVKAEALTIRAYDYFQLANIYGATYNPVTADSDMAVPMLLEPDLLAELPRVSVQKIYDQVIKDLKLAIDLFIINEIPEIRTNPSKTGAYGLLARVYLYMGDWENAAEYASLALSNYDFIMDYNEYSESSSDLTRSLIAPENQEAILFRKCTQSYCRSYEVILDNELINLFEANDLRFPFFTETNDDGMVIYSPNNSSNVFPISGISTTEMLLTRAEANARLKNLTEAMDDLFTLRIKRFDITAYPDQASFESDISLSANTSEEALQLVLEERRRELCFQGLRWFDMRRLMEEGRYTKTLTRTINGKTYTLEPGADKYVVDISPEIKSWNSLL
jgi:tetratricopeptide (TPR) repeat protein